MCVCVFVCVCVCVKEVNGCTEIDFYHFLPLAESILINAQVKSDAIKTTLRLMCFAIASSPDPLPHFSYCK